MNELYEEFYNNVKNAKEIADEICIHSHCDICPLYASNYNKCISKMIDDCWDIILNDNTNE